MKGLNSANEKVQHNPNKPAKYMERSQTLHHTARQIFRLILAFLFTYGVFPREPGIGRSCCLMILQISSQVVSCKLFQVKLSFINGTGFCQRQIISGEYYSIYKNVKTQLPVF